MAEYLYSKDHEWVLRESNLATVGVSEFAQSELGEIAFVEQRSGSPQPGLTALAPRSPENLPVKDIRLHCSPAVKTNWKRFAMRSTPMAGLPEPMYMM